MIVAPNLVRLEPMETRHLELSKDIKFEEIGRSEEHTSELQSRP